MNADFSPRPLRIARLAGAGDPLLTLTPEKVAGAAIAGVVVLGGYLVYRRIRRSKRGRR
jgi:hypothetical protein